MFNSCDEVATAREKITAYHGTGQIYKTNTRCLFNDWLEFVRNSGQISDTLWDEIQTHGIEY
jgi:hypothetical protein